MMSLLQPPPEVFDLFDDVMLLRSVLLALCPPVSWDSPSSWQQCRRSPIRLSPVAVHDVG
jgi:hypothetical protein